MVTNTLLKGALLHCKKASFTPQKGTFYHVKGHLLQCKRPSIKKQLRNYFTTRRDNTLSFLSIPLFHKTLQRKSRPSLSTVF